MNQKELIDKLENLEAKVQLLADRYVSLKKELAATLEENLELKALVKSRIFRLMTFKINIKLVKL